MPVIRPRAPLCKPFIGFNEILFLCFNVELFGDGCDWLAIKQDIERGDTATHRFLHLSCRLVIPAHCHFYAHWHFE